MTGLLFQFQEMANEVEAISELAQPFLDNRSRLVLPGFRGFLDNYRGQNTDQPTDWEISRRNPLLTDVSHGKYEAGGGGGVSVYAEITAKWRIQRLRPKKASQPAEKFRLIGIASTKVRLLCLHDNEDEPRQVAMWRMEVGDDQAPGCHFHIQILGETDDYPFPRSVPVPRLPGLLLTPALVVEFVLGELFQDEWLQHIARDSANLHRWIPIQKRRFENLLDWHIDTLGRGGSPWSQLKRTKPREDLFLLAGRQ